MILAVLAVVLGVGLLVWLWKGPIQKMVTSMEESGSSTIEAYGVIVFVSAAMGVAAYLIMGII